MTDTLGGPLRVRGRPRRARGELAYHALDVTHTVLEAAEQGKPLLLEGRAARREALPKCPAWLALPDLTSA